MVNKEVKPKTILKNFWGDNEHFADVINSVLFEGKEVLKPDLLEESDSEVSSVIKLKENTISLERIRDVVKKTMLGMDWVIIGIENQMKPHYGMPLRTMLYDSLNYLKQWNELEKKNRKEKNLKTPEEFLSGITKEDRLKPVITLVIYYGEEAWDGPKSLREMISSVDEKLDRLLPDYGMNLLEVRNSEKYQFKNQEVEDVFEISRNIFEGKYDILKEQYSTKSISSEIAAVVGAITGSDSLIKYARDSGREEIDMCKALEELREEGKLEGERRILSLIQRLLSENRVDEIKEVSSNEEYREKMYEKYGL